MGALLPRAVAEITGTCGLVVFIKLGSTFAGPGFAPLAIGFGLSIMIFNWGYISGGHYNPSVTTAVAIRGPPGFKLQNVGLIALYMGCQLLGALLGGFMAWGIGGKSAGKVYPFYESQNGVGTTRAFFGEVFFTFLLCSAVLHNATDQRDSNNHFYGFAIGLTVMVSAMCIGPVSGACLNFAVYFGTTMSAMGAHDKASSVKIHQVWLYLFAPLLGAALAGLLFRLVYYVPSADDDTQKGPDAGNTLGERLIDEQ